MNYFDQEYDEFYTCECGKKYGECDCNNAVRKSALRKSTSERPYVYACPLARKCPAVVGAMSPMVHESKCSTALEKCYPNKYGRLSGELPPYSRPIERRFRENVPRKIDVRNMEAKLLRLPEEEFVPVVDSYQRLHPSAITICSKCSNVHSTEYSPLSSVSANPTNYDFPCRDTRNVPSETGRRKESGFSSVMHKVVLPKEEFGAVVDNYQPAHPSAIYNCSRCARVHNREYSPLSAILASAANYAISCRVMRNMSSETARRKESGFLKIMHKVRSAKSLKYLESKILRGKPCLICGVPRAETLDRPCKICMEEFLERPCTCADKCACGQTICRCPRRQPVTEKSVVTQKEHRKTAIPNQSIDPFIAKNVRVMRDSGSKLKHICPCKTCLCPEGKCRCNEQLQKIQRTIKYLQKEKDCSQHSSISTPLYCLDNSRLTNCIQPEAMYSAIVEKNNRGQRVTCKKSIARQPCKENYVQSEMVRTETYMDIMPEQLLDKQQHIQITSCNEDSFRKPQRQATKICAVKATSLHDSIGKIKFSGPFRSQPIHHVDKSVSVHSLKPESMKQLIVSCSQTTSAQSKTYLDQATFFDCSCSTQLKSEELSLEIIEVPCTKVSSVQSKSYSDQATFVDCNCFTKGGTEKFITKKDEIVGVPCTQVSCAIGTELISGFELEYQTGSRFQQARDKCISACDDYVMQTEIIPCRAQELEKGVQTLCAFTPEKGYCQHTEYQSSLCISNSVSAKFVQTNLPDVEGTLKLLYDVCTEYILDDYQNSEIRTQCACKVTSVHDSYFLQSQVKICHTRADKNDQTQSMTPILVNDQKFVQCPEKSTSAQDSCFIESEIYSTKAEESPQVPRQIHIELFTERPRIRKMVDTYSQKPKIHCCMDNVSAHDQSFVQSRMKMCGTTQQNLEVVAYKIQQMKSEYCCNCSCYSDKESCHCNLCNFDITDEHIQTSRFYLIEKVTQTDKALRNCCKCCRCYSAKSKSSGLQLKEKNSRRHCAHNQINRCDNTEKILDQGAGTDNVTLNKNYNSYLNKKFSPVSSSGSSKCNTNIARSKNAAKLNNFLTVEKSVSNILCDIPCGLTTYYAENVFRNVDKNLSELISLNVEQRTLIKAVCEAILSLNTNILNDVIDRVDNDVDIKQTAVENILNDEDDVKDNNNIPQNLIQGPQSDEKRFNKAINLKTSNISENTLLELRDDQVNISTQKLLQDVFFDRNEEAVLPKALEFAAKFIHLEEKINSLSGLVGLTEEKHCIKKGCAFKINVEQINLEKPCDLKRQQQINDCLVSKPNFHPRVFCESKSQNNHDSVVQPETHTKHSRPDGTINKYDTIGDFKNMPIDAVRNNKYAIKDYLRQAKYNKGLVETLVNKIENAQKDREVLPSLDRKAFCNHFSPGQNLISNQTQSKFIKNIIADLEILKLFDNSNLYNLDFETKKLSMADNPGVDETSRNQCKPLQADLLEKCDTTASIKDNLDLRFPCMSQMNNERANLRVEVADCKTVNSAEVKSSTKGNNSKSSYNFQSETNANNNQVEAKQKILREKNSLKSNLHNSKENVEVEFKASSFYFDGKVMSVTIPASKNSNKLTKGNALNENAELDIGNFILRIKPENPFCE